MITKKNKTIVQTKTKISDAIIANPYLMLMLEHFGVKLEVREKTIEQICNEYNISTKLFLTIVNLFNGIKPATISEYSFSEIKTILTYLKNCHYYYQNEKYPQIQHFIQQIYKVNNHAEILMIERFFNEYFKEVTEHLNYENTVVFPYVLNLNNILAKLTSQNIQINYSVVEYKEHHNDIEEKLTDLKNLLIKYLPQKNDQQLRRQLLFSLFELEHDLKIHSQIEDTILIPLVEKMEHLQNTTND